MWFYSNQKLKLTFFLTIGLVKVIFNSRVSRHTISSTTSYRKHLSFFIRLQNLVKWIQHRFPLEQEMEASFLFQSWLYQALLLLYEVAHKPISLSCHIYMVALGTSCHEHWQLQGITVDWYRSLLGPGGRSHNSWKWANSHELEQSVNTITSLHVSSHCYNNECDLT